MTGMTVTKPFRVRREGQRRKKASAESDLAPNGRVPRVARLMALAIQFDQLIRDGVVADQAELARLGQVTRARLTQIMNLLDLAPDIQEQILQHASGEETQISVSERQLRPIAATPHWRSQRRRWTKLLAQANNR